MFTVTTVRHGEAQSNVDGEDSVVGSDKPLTKEGIRQVKKTAAWMAGRIVVEHLFSSPKRRALETSEILAEAYGDMAVQIDERLDEIRKGAWEGQSVPAIIQKQGEIPKDQAPFIQPPQTQEIPGENWLDVGYRAASVILERLQCAEDNSLLVSHNHPLEAAIGLLEGRPMQQWEDRPISNAAVSQLLFSDGLWRPNPQIYNLKPYEL